MTPKEILNLCDRGVETDGHSSIHETVSLGETDKKESKIGSSDMGFCVDTKSVRVKVEKSAFTDPTPAFAIKNEKNQDVINSTVKQESVTQYDPKRESSVFRVINVQFAPFKRP